MSNINDSEGISGKYRAFSAAWEAYAYSQMNSSNARNEADYTGERWRLLKTDKAWEAHKDALLSAHEAADKAEANRTAYLNALDIYKEAVEMEKAKRKQ